MKAKLLSSRRILPFVWVAALAFGLCTNVQGQEKLTLSKDQVDLVKWRSIGPANMGGRITSLAVYEKDPNIWWAASASGGLLKTVNNGITFEHQFDDQSTVSIGDVQVAQSDPNIVWVGTGEANPRNSVSWGDGVYKSTDGGKTWTNMGLKKIFQTGRIAIHPKNPNIVYVGALGRLWGPNEDRGLFKTTDGGKTWEKILYVDDKTGVIDVQMNMKNPDQLMVATYERQRDGFDGNDPGKKYGAGSAIYYTVNGGKDFTKSTEGLPTCKLGRVGLSIYRKDPKYVYAIVESERIAKEPENSAYAGIQGQDVEVGARITRVTDNSPAAKAGIKQDDIVVQVNGEQVHSYQDLQVAIRKAVAGDKSKWVVSRDKETVELKLDYTKKPSQSGNGNRSRRGNRNIFTGTLGGQAANLQDQQGKEGFQFGGIYMSKNFGKSWTRINTLNPRPMYYSQIRVDPSDRNYMYVCGTSLYRSKDGGKTFTGDGGSDGIHVDHHAMYVDPRDGRHIILGNDGGIHVTHDRMDHWDHLNHVAIGQFYHVGVSANPDYHVYGGLQDNGSWGAPARAQDGSLVNSDWYRVGGGDGFICLVDPNDKDQVYYESQNGSMGTINFRTGARGSARPRSRSGVRYRFNWKTPFILSPHNSKIHYSAGNYVFKSDYKSNGVKPISPDITNTDRGAGSAISESPAEAGVIYVGTTDGAVWMTRNGGKDWSPIFSTKDGDSKEDKADSDSGARRNANRRPGNQSSPSDEKPAADKPKKSDKADKISGTWNGEMTVRGRGGQGGRRNFTMELKLGDNGKVTGTVGSQRGSNDIIDGKFDAKSNQLSFGVESQRGERKYTAELKDGTLEGKMVISMGEREFEIEFTAKPDGGNEKVSASEADVLSHLAVLNSMVTYGDNREDQISGTWKGKITSDQLPDGGIDVTLTLKMDEKGHLTGRLSAPDAPGDGELDVVEGKFNSEKNKLYFFAENDDVGIDAEAVLEGKTLTGDMQINDEITIDFSVELVKKAVAKKDKKSKARNVITNAKLGSTSSKAKTEVKTSAKVTAAKAASASAKSTPSDASAQTIKDDVVSGKWEGNFISDRMPAGSTGFSMDLKMDAKGKVTGKYETQRGGGEITEGKFDQEKGSIRMLAESDNFSLEFTGTVKSGNMEGQVDFAGGQFTLDFEAKRVAAAEKAVAKTETNKAANRTAPLADLVPGPRWVSSLEASRFKRGRCYITLDGHRSNDDQPYVFMSEDYGKTWKSILANIPATAGSTRVLREDIENENLLYLGCEFSAWVSVDRGQSWTRLGGGFPTVAVHEFAIHPTQGEVVAGTHGRSLWIADVSALRQMTSENLTAKAALMKPKEVIRWRNGKSRGASGTRRFVGDRPSRGTSIIYSLGTNARSVSVQVSTLEGEVIKTFESPSTAKGVHALNWDLRGGARGRGRFGPSVGEGSYLVTLKVDGNQMREVLKVSPDPTTPNDAVAEDEELNWWLEASEGDQP